MDGKKKILLLFTGGTIASVKTEKGLEPLLDARQILELLPDIGEEVELSTIEICNLDSTDMTYHYWLKMAKAIQEHYEEFDGFVICHGTDTMAYTSAALSYLIQNSRKPIVLTGSQQPIQMEITDAKKNLTDSIFYAADEKSSGVSILFDGKVIAGTRAKKTNSFSYRAFSSINFPEIASIQHGKIIRYLFEEKKEENVKFYHNLNPRVYPLKLVPGMSPSILDAIFKEYDCVIIESFGVGGVPESLIKDLKAQDKSKIIIMTTQVTYEGSNLSTYEVGKRMKGNINYIEAYDMNFEAVFTKIMWILGMENISYEKVEELFYQKINYDVLL